MKKATLVLLCAVAALLVACGGSEQTAENTDNTMQGPEGSAMTGPDSTTNSATLPQNGTPEELKKYLTDNYSEDELKQMLIEIIATQDAATEHYSSGNKEDMSTAELMAVTENIRKELNAAIERVGINMKIYANLTMMATENGWYAESGFQEAVDARSAEINAAR